MTEQEAEAWVGHCNEALKHSPQQTIRPLRIVGVAVQFVTPPDKVIVWLHTDSGIGFESRWRFMFRRVLGQMSVDEIGIVDKGGLHLLDYGDCPGNVLDMSVTIGRATLGFPPAALFPA